MKRVLRIGLGVILVTGAVSLTGCGGGGIEPGIPQDTTISPENLAKLRAMGSALPPPAYAKSKKAPAPGGGATPAK